ncbi:transposase [Chryseobacterium angstadtii]|uniref:Transposase n=1 Tax=Chryseobacterium angstadtii TaxID=558151 RepID=A0A0J7KSJ1_9FLAO|nr:transposase [Chryseobacterium angstadtii]KMQ60150.1 transposase [Chryseobacterium angstadtii]
MNFNKIHIGKLIEARVAEADIELARIKKYLNLSEERVRQMYEEEHLDTEILLRMSKLLEYDFFRIYSQHLILYAPQTRQTKHSQEAEETKLPVFRKNIYTQEIIDFMLELIFTNEKTKTQITEEYNIPKTTLYKWISKYKNRDL